jgi:hypothetical protein
LKNRIQIGVICMRRFSNDVSRETLDIGVADPYMTAP